MSSLRPPVLDRTETATGGISRLTFEHRSNDKDDVRKKRHDLANALQTMETLLNLILGGEDVQKDLTEKKKLYLRKALDVLTIESQYLLELYKEP